MVVKREHTHAAAHHKGRSEVEGEEGRETENKPNGKDATEPELPRVARQPPASVYESIP